MQTLRLLAVIEASTVTGPAKNLLQFGTLARSGAFDTRVELSIAVFQRPGASTVFLEAARDAALQVYPIVEKGRFDRSVVAGLRELHAKLAPDVAQSHAVKSHFLIKQSGIHHCTPWIAFHHGYTWPDLRARLYNQLDRWSLPAAPQVVTVSEPFRRELVSIGVRPERIEVVHNSIEADWGRRDSGRPSLRGELGIPSGAKVVLIVGRLSSEKDHATLLEAVHQLNSAGAFRVHLLIVGDGPERQRIQEIVRRHGIDESVTLAGQVPTAEPYYAIADVAVLSSLSEGSPNALLEAMAAGVPAVCTNVGGIPEIVAHGESALLVPTRSAAEMRDALAAVLNSAELRERLVQGAQRIIAERHTPEIRVRRLLAVYRRVLARKAEGNPV